MSGRRGAAVGATVLVASAAVLAGSLAVARVALGRLGGGVAAHAEGGGAPAPEISSDQVLGGERVPAARLERGGALYDRYCAICHGEGGDGMGPSAPFLWPPPRDFRAAQFKFTGAPEGELPHDDELARVVRRGLAGTGMQPWDLPDQELGPILDYIKTFSPPERGFRDPYRKPARAEIPPDPYRDQAARQRARDEGERLYHAVFQCNSCHPSYVGPEALAGWGAAERPVAPLDPVPKWSATYRSVLLPPDFLRHELRSIATGGGARLDHDLVDLYRLVANGMNGPMPGYGHLDPAQVWAVVHYTKWLADQRGSEEGRALRRRLEDAWGAGGGGALRGRSPAGTR
ncbi:MAG TPA: c-type cytochrome [Kofleriaceae bacterium]|nr:c-type cytochrome [Kofleriaceae bacterium]